MSNEENKKRKYECNHCKKDFNDRRYFWYHTKKMKACCRSRKECAAMTQEYGKLQEQYSGKTVSELERLYQYIICLNANDENLQESEKKIRDFFVALIKKNTNLPNKFIETFIKDKDRTQIAPCDIREFMKLITTKRQVPAALKKTIAYEQNYKCTVCDQNLPPSYHIDHIKPLYIGGTNLRANLQAMCMSCHGDKTLRDEIDLFYLIESIVKKI